MHIEAKYPSFDRISFRYYCKVFNTLVWSTGVFEILHCRLHCRLQECSMKKLWGSQESSSDYNWLCDETNGYQGDLFSGPCSAKLQIDEYRIPPPSPSLPSLLYELRHPGGDVRGGRRCWYNLASKCFSKITFRSPFHCTIAFGDR